MEHRKWGPYTWLWVENWVTRIWNFGFWKPGQTLAVKGPPFRCHVSGIYPTLPCPGDPLKGSTRLSPRRSCHGGNGAAGGGLRSFRPGHSNIPDAFFAVSQNPEMKPIATTSLFLGEFPLKHTWRWSPNSYVFVSWRGSFATHPTFCGIPR